MSAPTKNVVALPVADTVTVSDKLLMVDISDTSEGPLGTVKISEAATVGQVFDPQIAAATTQANNAASSATAAANSAAAAAEIVNISEVQTFTNPLQLSSRVAMTGASSGSRGWLVQDNVNVDNPTNDFTLTVPGVKLSDYSPSAEIWLYYKYEDANNYWGWKINTAGTMTFIAVVASVTIINVTSTVAIPSTRDADFIKPSIAITRETASAAGAAVFGVDGIQLGDSVAITAAATADISNSGSLYILGTNAIRYASEVLAAIMFNRALSAPEVLSLCINGVDPADVGADQSVAYVSDFSAGTDGMVPHTGVTLTGNQDGIAGEDDWLKAERTGGTDVLRFSQPGLFVVGRNSEVKGVKVHNPAGTPRYLGVFVSVFPSTISTPVADAFVLIPAGGTATVSDLLAICGLTAGDLFFCTVDSSGVVQVVNTGITLYFKGIRAKQSGATLHLSAQDAQSNTGQVFDSSGNGNHALLPASGATVLGKPVSEPRQVRGTNSWAETHELQYIGGSNHPILPANAIIESIVGVITSTGGSGVQDIIIGDGSDPDRYVEITTGLTTGTKIFTLTATPFTDGTNLKLTVDPDSNCTMSIAWTITYRTLEN